MRKFLLLGWLASAALPLAMLGGCVSPDEYRAMMQSEVPKERAQGCKYAGSYGSRSDVPLLVDRLNDKDSAVRMWANQSLRKLTGEDFGYNVWGTESEKNQAIQRWREYAADIERPTPPDDASGDSE